MKLLSSPLEDKANELDYKSLPVTALMCVYLVVRIELHF